MGSSVNCRSGFKANAPSPLLLLPCCPYNQHFPHLVFCSDISDALVESQPIPTLQSDLIALSLFLRFDTVMHAFSLEELNQQIAQREQELEALRRELESRRDQFTALKRRKDELLEQLRQVEADIAALTSAPLVPSPSRLPKERPTLPDVILAALRDAGKAMTARQLSEEVLRRGFPLTGRNPAKSVDSRLREMKRKGLVQRASGQPGYILTPSALRAEAGSSPTIAPVPKEGRKAARQAGQQPSAKPAKPKKQERRSSLRDVLTNVLKNSRKPLSGNELVDLVLASGYQTKSTNLVKTIWSLLAQMDNVEHIRGKGYQLKKA